MEAEPCRLEDEEANWIAKGLAKGSGCGAGLRMPSAKSWFILKDEPEVRLERVDRDIAEKCLDIG